MGATKNAPYTKSKKNFAGQKLPKIANMSNSVSSNGIVEVIASEELQGDSHEQ